MAGNKLDTPADLGKALYRPVYYAHPGAEVREMVARAWYPDAGRMGYADPPGFVACCKSDAAFLREAVARGWVYERRGWYAQVRYWPHCDREMTIPASHVDGWPYPAADMVSPFWDAVRTARLIGTPL
jgi:hypothetical protein